MKHLLMLSGAAALAFSGPVLAKPGNGHGHGYAQGYGHGNGHGRGHAYAQGYGHGNGHGRGRGYAPGYGDRGRIGYGVGGCPPGLARKHNGCMPPGQAKKLYRGQRYPYGFGSRYAYGQIPNDLRRRYDLDPYDRYYYSGGYLYRVDPRTMLVEQVISALLYR